MNRHLGVVLALLLPLAASGQNFDPPPTVKPSEEQLREIRTRMEKLETAIAGLKKKGRTEAELADVAIFHKAAEWIVRHGEFYQKEYIDWTIEGLDRGLERAGQMEQGKTPWLGVTGRADARAYHSRVDGSVQPFGVTLPADYGKDPKRIWRVDFVLHGRNTKLTEVSFLHQFNGAKAAPKDRDFIQVDIYGRGNNAYRWAGETDVHEVSYRIFIEKSAITPRLGQSQTVLRGFSMGGAGAWHIGLHEPRHWWVLGPGAGFTNTHGYIKNLPEKLPPYQEACLHIYDAVDYAENAFNIPVVAYSGDKDPQMQAATNIEKRLEGTPFKFTHLVAPGLGHTFPPEWQAKADAEYRKHLGPERYGYRKRVRFVTYTLKYPTCDWVQIRGLEEQYKKALVDAEYLNGGYRVKTENVRILSIVPPPDERGHSFEMEIDGQKIKAAMAPELSWFALERRDGKWAAVGPDVMQIQQVLTKKQKRGHYQGPIDDAFTGPFLCVRGTGKPWHTSPQRYADADLKRFETEWSKYLRGSLPVKDDVDVTAEDIKTKHLILFGDPASNSVIKTVLDKLPLEWTREKISFSGRSVSSANHVPVMIFPNPLGRYTYIVLNSGHTFHVADFQGTNALLYPRLGDYALLKLTGDEKDPLKMEVVTAGLFDEFWRIPK